MSDLTGSANPLVRQLASLKVLSRLLAHELHTQGSTRSVTLSREEVNEMKTTLDLFIEEAGKRLGGSRLSQSSGTVSQVELTSRGETALVPARN
tara:strand:- start:14557 stop:14838 length:282 start_codon:yes stop_codon:yes gene_type:complete